LEKSIVIGTGGAFRTLDRLLQLTTIHGEVPDDVVLKRIEQLTAGDEFGSAPPDEAAELLRLARWLGTRKTNAIATMKESEE
jgi:hypothetical protein